MRETQRKEIKMNYERTAEEFNALQNAGIEPEAMGLFTVEHEGDYLQREYVQNRMESGYDVPEEFQPVMTTRKERELKYQSKMMYDLEGERVNRVPQGFPDPYKWYDEDEMCFDSNREWIPIWLRDKRERDAEAEEKWLQYCREKHNRGRNLSSAQRLSELRDRKLKEIEEERSRRLEVALREREERLQKVSK